MYPRHWRPNDRNLAALLRLRSISAAVLACLIFVTTSGARAQLRVAVIADLNGRYGSTAYEPSVARAISRLIEIKPDLVLCLGDMIAGQRRHPPFSERQLNLMWSAFHKFVTDPLAASHIPFATVAGNHDASAFPGFERERNVYREQWTPRQPQLKFVDSAGYPFHYAFAAGDVLFIALDGTTTGEIDPAEKTWLRQVLAQQGSRYRWRLILTHVPSFPFVPSQAREIVSDPEFEAILREGGVQMVLSGHHHAFYPGVSNGVTWISQGCLGAAPRRLQSMAAKSPRTITLIDLPAAGPANVRALREPDFQQILPLNDLPRAIRSGRTELTRLDLASPSR